MNEFRIGLLILAMSTFPGHFLAFGQAVTSTQPVSDATAYRFVMLTISLPDNPSATDILKRDQRFKRFSLSPVDEQALKALLVTFRREYTTWQAALATTMPTPNLVSQREDIVQRYRTLIGQTLTASGKTALDQYTMSEKQKMHP